MVQLFALLGSFCPDTAWALSFYPHFKISRELFSLLLTGPEAGNITDAAIVEVGPVSKNYLKQSLEVR